MPEFSSGQVRVRQEGTAVLLIMGTRTAVIPWEAAQELGRAILAKAAEAETVQKAEQVTFDSALLLRSGAPFQLTSNRDIMAAAKVEAQHHPTLRRHMSSIKTKEEFGAPQVIRRDPK